MYILKELVKAIIFRIISFLASAFFAGVTDALLGTDTSGWYGLFLMISMFCLLEYFFRDRNRKIYKKYKKASAEFNMYQDIMSGSLVALYNKTRESRYKLEYLRRLKMIGFSNEEADSMFQFEFKIVRYDGKGNLTDNKYIYKPEFDYKSIPLPQGDKWYVEHQMFLLSELVKICDEAENTWTYSKEQITDETIRNRVYTLTRYGEENLFVSYLKMMNDESHISMDLLKAYAKAEQDLLYRYRWKIEAVDNPYQG